MTQSYGPSIPTNGTRPDWVDDDDIVSCSIGGETSECKARLIDDWTYPFRVRANHPHYAEANVASIDPEDGWRFASLAAGQFQTVRYRFLRYLSHREANDKDGMIDKAEETNIGMAQAMGWYVSPPSSYPDWTMTDAPEVNPYGHDKHHFSVVPSYLEDVKAAMACTLEGWRLSVVESEAGFTVSYSSPDGCKSNDRCDPVLATAIFAAALDVSILDGAGEGKLKRSR